MKTFGWRRRACSPATQPKPWWRRPSATCRSPSASTSEPLSWRLTSGPRSEFSGRVRLLDKLEWNRSGLNKTMARRHPSRCFDEADRCKLVTRKGLRVPPHPPTVHNVPRFPCRREGTKYLLVKERNQTQPSSVHRLAK